MLEKIDLKQKMKKDEYDKKLDYYGDLLGKLQRECRSAKIPVIILVEGWRGAMRTDIINEMMQRMDSRGFRVFSASKMTEEQRKQPFFTSFWKQLPCYGNIVVYHRSWYFLKNEHVVADKSQVAHWLNTSYSHIRAFEKQLTDDGYVLLKFFVHVSKKQQKENMEKLNKIYGKNWKKLDVEEHDENDYDKFINAYEEMFAETDTENAPWHLIAGDDERYATIQIIESIVKTLQNALAAAEIRAQNRNVILPPRHVALNNVLEKVDLSKSLTKEEYKAEFAKCREKLKQLQLDLYEAQRSLIVAFEGWDAGGKGGAIKRLARSLDPLGYAVNPYAAPNPVEKQFHYMWRFWVKMPRAGEIAIFDRTWYGRVMVERIEHFATDAEWQRAYGEINETEAQWTEHGIIMCKFWLQIDKDEQYRRFKERENDPDKEWKITDEDWRNREKWDVYEAAVNEMLIRTSTDYAPWTVVEGNSKYYARIKVLKTVIEAIEKAIKYIIVISTIIISWNYIWQDNASYLAIKVMQNQTENTALRIVDRIENLDNFNEEMPVLIVGNLKDNNYLSRENKGLETKKIFDRTWGFISSEPTVWEDNQDSWNKMFYEYVGVNLKLVGKDDCKNILETEEYKTMSNFPDEDSIKIIKNIVVVKISD